RFLFSPSLPSGIIVIFTTIAILLLNFWLFATEDPSLREYFFGPRGIFTALVASPNTQAAFAGELFNARVTYYVLLVASGVLVGMTAYAVLQGLSHLFERF